MTSAQKQNRQRFKEVQAEAKKLRSKNPSLTQAQAVKQAWAIEYNVAGKTKTKKQVRKKVGALPIGFTGKILGVPFKVINQYDIYNNVNAIVEDTNNGKTIIVIDGKKSIKELADKFYNYIKVNVDYSTINEIPKDTLKRITNFVSNMTKEVKDFNAGKKETIKKQPLVIDAKIKSIKKVSMKKKSSVKKSSLKSPKKLTYVGVRKLESGASRYEYKLAGLGELPKEFSMQQAQEYTTMRNKPTKFYFNIFGWETYYTLKPTFATPTGKSKGFPRIIIFKP